MGSDKPKGGGVEKELVRAELGDIRARIAAVEKTARLDALGKRAEVQARGRSGR